MNLKIITGGRETLQEDQHPRVVRLSFSKEYLKFSAAHFTIFSATERERLHGHNFTVAVDMQVSVGDDGLASNYRVYKDELKKCCAELDEYLILPQLSPHLIIESNAGEYVVQFHKETMRFLQADTQLLPIRNTTVEEFSHYLLNQLLSTEVFAPGKVSELSVTVASGPGQSGTSSWSGCA